MTHQAVTWVTVVTYSVMGILKIRFLIFWGGGGGIKSHTIVDHRGAPQNVKTVMLCSNHFQQIKYVPNLHNCLDFH